METNEYEKQALDFLEKTETSINIEYDRHDYYFDDDKVMRNIFKVTLKNKRSQYTFTFGDSLFNSNSEIQKPKILSDRETTVYYGFKHSLTVKHEHVYFEHSIKTSYPVLRAISEGKTDLETLLNMEQIQKDYNDYIDRIKAFNKVGYNYGHGKINIENKTDFDTVVARIRKRIYDAIKEAKEETETVNEGQKDSIEKPSVYSILACLTKYNPGTFENFCSDYGYDTDSRKAEKTYNAVVDEYENLIELFTDDELELMAEIQ